MGTKTKPLQALREEAAKQLRDAGFVPLDAIRLGQLRPIEHITLEELLKGETHKLGRLTFSYTDMLDSDGHVPEAILANLQRTLETGLDMRSKLKSPWKGQRAGVLVAEITGMPDKSLLRLFNFDASAPKQQRVLDLVVFVAVALAHMLATSKAPFTWVRGPHQAVLCFLDHEGVEQQLGVIGNTVVLPFDVADHVPKAYADCGRENVLRTAKPEGGSLVSPWTRAWSWLVKDQGFPEEHPLAQALRTLHWRTAPRDPDAVLWYPEPSKYEGRRRVLALVRGEVDNGYGLFHFRDWLVPHLVSAPNYEKLFVASVRGLNTERRREVWLENLRKLAPKSK